MWPTVERSKLEAAVGVVMRVPGLFIIDYWWQYERTKSVPHSMAGPELLNAAITNLVLLHGFLLLLLPMRHVRALYTHLVSGALLLSGHILSLHYIQIEETAVAEDDADQFFWKRQLSVALIQFLLAALVSSLLEGSVKPPFPILASYILPIAARVADFPVETLQVLHNFCSGVIAITIFMYIYQQLPGLLTCVKVVYSDTLLITEAYGWVTLLTIAWNRLFVPTHFFVFWMINFAVKVVENMSSPDKAHLWAKHWYLLVLSAASAVCSSPVTLFATSVTVSYLAYFILVAVKGYLRGHAALTEDNPMHSGWTEGLTLVVLALQTGLTEMKLPSRMAVMVIILFIVLSSLLQSIYDITEPVVLALSASRSKNVSRHLRALSLCVFLFLFPLYIARTLAEVFPLDFCMVVVLSSCIMTSVQVVDLLVVHCLFVYDSYRTEPWESLDDVVYYTRAVTKVLEFFVAVYVVGVGLWESTTSQWNWANGSILLVHCYFNVWQRMQAGWHSFLQRRDASKKVDSLVAATSAQLARHQDVCAICYADMESACMTPCQHFFHRACLRKWLYIHDKCPLCHATVTIARDKAEDVASVDAEPPAEEGTPAPGGNETAGTRQDTTETGVTQA